MSNAPDDGGPYFPEMYRNELGEPCADDGIRMRARLAMHFAAAWLPIVVREDSGKTWPKVITAANELGLAMADDLIRRLRENA